MSDASYWGSSLAYHEIVRDGKFPSKIFEILLQGMNGALKGSSIFLQIRVKLALQLKIIPANITLHQGLDLGDASSFQKVSVCLLCIELAGAERQERFVEHVPVWLRPGGAVELK